MKLNSGWFSCVLVCFLSACSAGPDFERPLPPQAIWHAPLPHGGKIENLVRWWEQWDDPFLTQLISLAEKNNPTLEMAVAKLVEARANTGISEAARYPSLGASAGTTRSKMVFGTQVLEQTQDTVKFDAGWELDLFGKVRRGQEAAQARLQASEAGWHAARISLAGEVAAAYVELRTCEAGVALAEKELASHRSTRDLTELKQSSGFVSTSDWSRSQAAWEDAAAALVTRQSNCISQMNRLVELTGLVYANLETLLQARHGQIPAPQQISVDAIAARALSQRPDVAAAEFEWAAASADMGVAKADLYPSLTLLGSLGESRLITSGLTSNASIWSFGPTLKLPVFDGGASAGQVKAARARFDYAQANYHKTVRAAVKEIEDALVQVDTANARTAHNLEALGHYSALSQAGTARLQAGMGNQLAVEEAQRTVWLAEESVQGSQRESALAWISLYKALGGGWQDDTAKAEGK